MEKIHKIIRIKAGNTTYVVPEVISRKANKVKDASNAYTKDIYDRNDEGEEIDRIEEDKFENKYIQEVDRMRKHNKPQAIRNNVKETNTLEFTRDDEVILNKDGSVNMKENVNIKLSEDNFVEKRKIKKNRPTHFLQIPINYSASFAKKLEVFNKKIEGLDYSLSSYIYDKPKHFTLMVLNLDKDQEMLVSTILQDISMEILKIFSIDKYNNHKGYSFTLKGLGCFIDKSNEHPRVIFAELDDPKFKKKLDHVAHFLIKTFLDMGLIDLNDQAGIEYDEKAALYKVKEWHVTLLKSNTGFKDFGLMRQYKDFNFGQVEIDKMILSKMDKEHTPVCEIDI